jgi:PAS domain S-box-containing protein
MPDESQLLSSVNSVLGLSLILAQTSSPAQAMRLVTTAVPSIAASHSAVAWHPSSSGDYYERAPEKAARLLAGLNGAARLDLDGSAASCAFPITSPLAREHVFLIVTGSRDLSDQETFLLSVLAQLCGTVIANQELIAAERERLTQIAGLNAELEARGEANREREIAEARAAESALSEARHRAILEAALDAVISIDRYGRVTYVNSAFERTFGYRAEEVIGRDLAEKIVPSALREAHRHGFARYLETGQGVILDRRIEMPAMRADGTEFLAEVAVTRAGLPGEPAFTAYVRDITDRQRAENELMASRARLVTASDAARQRITRDLHDGAQQHLVATLISLQLAEQRWESGPDRARELLGQALRDTRRGIEELRELAAGLHPAVLAQHGLAVAVRGLADRVPVPVELDVPAIRLPAPVEASLYFFCAEALTNIVKHAQATRAWVRLEVTAGQCEVEVGDDGIGGARPRAETSGLIGLGDRIGALSGTLEITSPQSGGTVLRAAVPVSPGPAPLSGPQRLSRPAPGHRAAACAQRRVRRSACRSSSLVPPQMPASWRLARAHARQGTRTGHAAHTSLAWLICSSAGPALPAGQNSGAPYWPPRPRAWPTAVIPAASAKAKLKITWSAPASM